MSVEDRWMMDETGPDGKKTRKRVKSGDWGRGKRYRVRNTGAATRSFAKKTDATAWDVKVNGDLLNGVTPFDPRRGRVPAAAYMRTWAQERYANPRSRKAVLSAIEGHIVAYFGEEKHMIDIKASTAIAWRKSLDAARQRNGRPYAVNTITGWIDLFASIMKTAHTVDKIIQENPAQGLLRPTGSGGITAVTDVWEQPRVDSIVEHVGEHHHRYVAAPVLSATCGHRQGESFAVAVEDVSFLRKEITIRHQVQRDDDGTLVLCPPKKGKTRVVQLPEVTAFALAESIRLNGTTEVTCTCCNRVSHVIMTRRGRLVEKTWFNRTVWGPAVTAALTAETPEGHPVVRPAEAGQHQLRHVYASLLIDGGATVAEVMDAMGHATAAITMGIYTHLFKRSAAKVRGIIDGAFSAPVYRLRTAGDR